MVTKAVFIDYRWKKKREGFIKCKDVSWCLLYPWGMASRGYSAAVEGTSRCQYAHTHQLVCPHTPVSLSTHISHFAPPLHRILRRKATGAVPCTLLYIAFSGAFRRLLPRLLYWLSYVFLTSASQDSTFAMSIGRKGGTDGCDNGNQPLPFDWFVN